MPEIRTEKARQEWDSYLLKSLEIGGVRNVNKPTDLIDRKFVFYPEIGACPFVGTITSVHWTESTLSIEISTKYYRAMCQPIEDITFAQSWADKLWRLHYLVQNKECIEAIPGRLFVE